MKAIERAYKVSALYKLLQGNDKTARSLKPKLTLALDQFTGDELEVITTLFPIDEERSMMQVDLLQLEQHLGRKLQLIPEPPSCTF